jgi:cytidylate kinase
MIVAFARELGAGGREIGERVARALNAELLDNQIVDLVAARLGAPAAYVQAHDEHVEGFVERLFRVITSAYPEAYAAEGLPDWSEERLAELTASIIRERSRTESLVVIGRGAPILLQNRPDVLRVLVIASAAARVRRLGSRLGYSPEDALREIRKSDQHRTAYVQQHYNADWRDPSLYDIVINTDRIDFDAAASLLLEATQKLARG